MLKKTLVSAAIAAAVSGTAYADFAQTVAGARTYDTAAFGSGSDALTVDSMATVVFTADSTIPNGQQGTLTLTLAGAQFAANVTTGKLTLTEVAGAQGVTLGVVITDGGQAGDSTVTFGLTLGTADLEATDTITFDFDAVDLTNASGLGTEGATVSVSAAFAAVGTIDPFQNFNQDVTITAATDQVVATSATQQSINFVASAANEADIELADRENFEDGTGTASQTVAVLGTVANASGGALDETGAAFDFLAADAVTVVVSGDFSSADAVCIDASANGACGDAADTAGTVNADENEATFVVSDSTDVNAAVDILLTTDGTTEIPLSDFTATATVNFSTATKQDLAAAAAADLASTSYAGLTAVPQRALVVTNANAGDVTFVRLTNTSSAEVDLFAQLTSQGGTATDLVELDPIGPRETVVLNSGFFNTTFDTNSLTGRSNVQFLVTTGSEGDIEVVNMIRAGGVLVQVEDNDNN